MRKFAMTPSMLAAILLIMSFLLGGCKPVTAPGAAASEAAMPEAPATEAATPEDVATEAAVPAAEAAPTAGVCTPGAGSIAVLLPDSSAPRWEMDDRRYLEGALTAAGVSFTIANAQGDPASQLAQAQEALVEGAKVLILTGINSEAGAAVIAEARAAGAAVIDYDRLTASGPGADLYVSFDNFAVGSLMAQTLEPLINGLGVQPPRVVQLDGDPGDNNATLVRAGYSSVATPFYSDGRWSLAADQAVPGWAAAAAHTIFSQILAEAGEEEINAVFAANDVLAGSVVQVIKAQNAAPVLLSGQDATVEGLQNILAGWQTMTVYKPIQQEASTAVVAALTLLNCEPVSTLNTTSVLNNGTTDIPAILLDPVVVTKDNIAATVIADGFRTWDELCVGDYEQFCPPVEAR